MPLSPREEELLATLEAQLRVDDPAFAAVLGSASSEPSSRPVPTRAALLLLVTLLAALAGLVVASTLLGDRLGVLATAALTGALLVPWFVAATRWAARFVAGRSAWAVGAPGSARRRPIGLRHAVLGIAAALAMIVLLPAPALGLVGLVVTLGVLPWLFLRAVERIERNGRKGRGGYRHPDTGSA